MDSSKNQFKNFLLPKNLVDISLISSIVILSIISLYLFLFPHHFTSVISSKKITAFTISDFTQATILSKDQSGSVIRDILVSDAADTDGNVTINKSILSRKIPTIFASIQINAPHGVGVAKAILILPNGETMGPAFSEINTKGNTLKSFAFLRSSTEWQVGRYVFVIRLSSGDTETIHILVK